MKDTNYYYFWFLLLILGVFFASCEKSEPSNVEPVNNSKKTYLSLNYLDHARVEIQDTAKWHYVAIVIHPNRRVEIYLDGLKKVDYFRPDLNYYYSQLYIGASMTNSWSNYYKGYLDELKVSTLARSQAEIQDYYSRATGMGFTKNAAQSFDVNFTRGLWRFDESNGTTTFSNAVTGSNYPTGELFGTYTFQPGVSGNCIYFDGKTGRGNCRVDIPTSPLTIEFWLKSSSTEGTVIQPYGIYSSDIKLSN